MFKTESAVLVCSPVSIDWDCIVLYYRAGSFTAKPIFCRTPRITLSMQCTVSTYHLGTVPSSPARPERSRALPGTSLVELRAVRSHAVAMWCTGPHEALTTSFFARS